MKTSTILGILLVVGVIGVFSIYVFNQNNSNNSSVNQVRETQTLENETQANNETPTVSELSGQNSKGKYVEYSSSALTSNQNVIFFAASWCPTCRRLDQAINSELDYIPENLTILKADFDSEIELRQKYGVTYQHTLVQVDANGTLLKKWNGGNDIASIIKELI